MTCLYAAIFGALILVIVRQHGGSIKVSDNKPQGTIMIVQLPVEVK